MISNKEKSFLSAVVYLHNNETLIQETLKKIYDLLNDNFEKFEIICVDDYSTDGSVSQIKNFAQKISNPVFTIINMSIYQGIELSLNAGVDMAIGDFVFEFDSLDIDYPLATIMEVYNRSLKGYDIVTASPGYSKNLSSFLFYTLFNIQAKRKYKIRAESFRILSRRAINRVHGLNVDVPYRKAILANCGLDMDIILYKQIHIDYSRQGRENIENRINSALSSLILFTDIAYKISLIFTVAMLIVSLAVGGYALSLYFGQEKPIEGWTTTMLFLSIGFIGIFLVFAIVIKYLSIIIDLVFKKQKYLVSSVEKISK
jgi:polyisoprenyl-phosphate glycosyltransferase